jgi:hypothetical protein
MKPFRYKRSVRKENKMSYPTWEILHNALNPGSILMAHAVFGGANPEDLSPEMLEDPLFQDPMVQDLMHLLKGK